VIVLLGCIYIPYWNGPGPGPYLNKDGSCSHPEGCARNELQWTLLEDALWITLSRPVWCLAWLVLTLACYFDYLPITNAILAAPIMAPLANLTFGAYLVHPIIIKIIAGNVDGYFNFSAGEAIQRALIFATLAYASATLTWCLVEKPFATMTGWLVPKGKKRPQVPAAPVNDPSAPAKTDETGGPSQSAGAGMGLPTGISLPNNEAATGQPEAEPS
jgi:hypothetical protein